MVNKCLDLVVSTGTRLFVSGLGNDRCPDPAVFTITETAIPGDTEIFVSALTEPLFQNEEIKFYKEEFFKKVLIGTAKVASNVAKGATTVPVELLEFIMLSGDQGVSIGLHEVIGIESASSQLSNQVNAVTLLNSEGWVSKSPGISEWNFQVTGYIPKDFISLKGYEIIKNAAINRKFLYVERHLDNGESKAGVVMVSSLSDQVQGSGYVQYSATFDGAEQNLWEFIDPRTSTTGGTTSPTTPPSTPTNPSQPQPTIVASAPKAGLINETQTLSGTASVSGDTISSVQFQVNTVNQGAADTTPPYSTSWTPTVKGSYSIRAIATASQGGTATSTAVAVPIYDTKLMGGSNGAGCSLGAVAADFILFDNNQSAGGNVATMRIFVGGAEVANFNYPDTAYNGKPFAFFNSANSTMYVGTITGSTINL